MASDPLSIKLYLPKGSATGLRTAEISNWSGKAIACSRAELGELSQREEASRPGIYLLVGTDTESGEPAVYIGEAEEVGKRLKQHLSKEFWVQVVAFVSKDENLTKAHIKYLEGKLIEIATRAGRASIVNSQCSGSRLPEADQAEMDVFLDNLLKLLPVLGVSHFKMPVSEAVSKNEQLACKIKGLTAYGQRSESGFVVSEGSRAVKDLRPSAKQGLRSRREELLARGVLEDAGDYLLFKKDYEFTSPSTAGRMIRGGSTNGLTAWKNAAGKSLKDIEEE